MPKRWLALVPVIAAILLVVSDPRAQTPPPGGAPAGAPGAPGAPGTGSDLELVERVNKARADYQKSLEQLHVHYVRKGDPERAKWAKDELIGFHRIPHFAFILRLDVPPPTLNGTQNVPEANQLLTWARSFKDKGGFGTDYLDNMRRAELLLQDLLNKYPHSNRISEAAYMLGDIYESKVYKQYARSAEYYVRCIQWNPKTESDARLRAARLYDRQLNDRSKAMEMYKEVSTHEADPKRHQEAEKRLKELSQTR